MFETFSYLPPLSDDQIARQVDYIVNNGWTPCLEFSEPELAYVKSDTTSRMGAVTSVSILCQCRSVDQQSLCRLAQCNPVCAAAPDGTVRNVLYTTFTQQRAEKYVLLVCAELLRQQVLDNVEAAHVRLHRPRAG